MRLVNRFCFAVLAGLVLVGSALGAHDPGAAAWPSGTAVVSYESEQALAAALERQPARVVRRIGALRVAALRPHGNVERYARMIGAEPGIFASSERRRASRGPSPHSFLRSPACHTSGSTRPCGRIKFPRPLPRRPRDSQSP